MYKITFIGLVIHQTMLKEATDIKKKYQLQIINI